MLTKLVATLSPMPFRLYTLVNVEQSGMQLPYYQTDYLYPVSRSTTPLPRVSTGHLTASGKVSASPSIYY